MIRKSFKKAYPNATEEDYEELFNKYYEKKIIRDEKIAEYKTEVLKHLQEMKVKLGPEEYYTMNPLYGMFYMYSGLLFIARSYLEAILKFINYFQERDIDFFDEFFPKLIKYEVKLEENPSLSEEHYIRKGLPYGRISPYEFAEFVLENFEENGGSDNMPLFITLPKIEIIA